VSVKLDIRNIPSEESGDFLFWHAEFGIFVQKSVLRAYFLELDMKLEEFWRTISEIKRSAGSPSEGEGSEKWTGT